MENQHRKITGYRELSQVEIDLMNQIKEKARDIELLIEAVKAHVSDQRTAASELDMGDRADEHNRLKQAEPARWVSIARTNFQTATMALIRAVAQPTTF